MIKSLDVMRGDDGWNKVSWNERATAKWSARAGLAVRESQSSDRDKQKDRTKNGLTPSGQGHHLRTAA